MVSVGVCSLIDTHRNHTLLSLLQLSIYFISFLKKKIGLPYLNLKFNLKDK